MMITRLKLLMGWLICLPLLLHTTTLAAAGSEAEPKRAILLVAFGTSLSDSKGAIDRVGEKVAKAFPNTEIRWAYTSKIIRKILRKRGEEILSPAEALAKLGEDGYSNVYVQSLHIIPGDEYDDLVQTANAFSKMPKGIRQVTVGTPLLWSDADMSEVASALMANVPAERKGKEAVVFMGHGSKHTSNVYYPAMQYYFAKVDANTYIGTVEGTPTLDDVVASLKAKGVKKVWLMPFMLVAGDHAVNDMAGSEPTSWKSLLTKEGFTVEVVLKGMGELDAIGSIWVKHLQQIAAGK
jgi:sirohydrochlorin cobaltochelatase